MNNEAWPSKPQTPEGREFTDQERLAELKIRRAAMDREIAEIESRLDGSPAETPTPSGFETQYSEQARNAQSKNLEYLKAAYGRKVPESALSLLALVWGYHQFDISYEREPSKDIQERLLAQMENTAPGYELFWDANKPVDASDWNSYFPETGRPNGVWQLKKVIHPGLMFQGQPVVPAEIEVG